MLFDKIYETIKQKGEFDSYINKAINYIRKNCFLETIPSKLACELTDICTNGCEECCSNCIKKGEYFNITYLKKFLHKTNSLGLTGGEPLLHPNLAELINLYIKKNKRSDDIRIHLMTSGINPKSNNELIKQYYDNLELIYEKDNSIPQLKCYINFTYSDGIEPRERLEEFLKEYKRLFDKYGWLWLEFMIITKDDPDKKEKELKQIHEKIVGFYAERIQKGELIKGGRKEIDFLDVEDKCHINNDLVVNVNGDLNICCFVGSKMKKLIPYANIKKHSWEEIIDRRLAYIGLLKEFQEENDYSCKTCLNNGFNDFLKAKLG
jgi:organic radical activating enzyme